MEFMIYNSILKKKKKKKIFRSKWYLYYGIIFDNF